jgi:hypothetical protein
MFLIASGVINMQEPKQSIPKPVTRHIILRQYKCQDGMTMIGVALILFLIGFFTMLAVRLFPVYMENFNVVSHLEHLADEAVGKSMSDQEVLSTLFKRFDIDDVKHVKREHIFIERDDKSMTVAIEYEVRTPAVGNIDMVVSFVEEVDIN